MDEALEFAKNKLEKIRDSFDTNVHDLLLLIIDPNDPENDYENLADKIQVNFNY